MKWDLALAVNSNCFGYEHCHQDWEQTEGTGFYSLVGIVMWRLFLVRQCDDKCYILCLYSWFFVGKGERISYYICQKYHRSTLQTLLKKKIDWKPKTLGEHIHIMHLENINLKSWYFFPCEKEFWKPLRMQFGSGTGFPVQNTKVSLKT